MSNLRRINVTKTLEEIQNSKTPELVFKAAIDGLMHGMNMLNMFSTVLMIVNLVQVCTKRHLIRDIDRLLPEWLTVHRLHVPPRPIPSKNLLTFNNLLTPFTQWLPDPKTPKMFVFSDKDDYENFVDGQVHYSKNFSSVPMDINAYALMQGMMALGKNDYVMLLKEYFLWGGDVPSFLQRLAGYSTYLNPVPYNSRFPSNQKQYSLAVVYYKVLYPDMEGIEITNHMSLALQKVKAWYFRLKGTATCPGQSVIKEVGQLDYNYNPYSKIVPYGVSLQKWIDTKGQPPFQRFFDSRFAKYMAKNGDQLRLYTASTKREITEIKPDEPYPAPRVIFNAHWVVKYGLQILVQAYNHALKVFENHLRPSAIGVSWAYDGVALFIDSLIPWTGEEGPHGNMERVPPEDLLWWCGDVKRMDQSLHRTTILYYISLMRRSLHITDGPSRLFAENVLDPIIESLKGASVVTLDGKLLSFIITSGLLSGTPGTSSIDTFASDMVHCDIIVELTAFVYDGFNPAHLVPGQCSQDDLKMSIGLMQTIHKEVYRWRSYGDDILACINAAYLHKIGFADYLKQKGLTLETWMVQKYKNCGYVIKPGTEKWHKGVDSVKFLGCSFDITYDGNKPLYGRPIYDTQKLYVSLMQPHDNPGGVLAHPPVMSDFQKGKRPTPAEIEAHSNAAHEYSIKQDMWYRARYLGLAIVGYHDIAFYNVCRMAYALRSTRAYDAEIARTALNECVPDQFPTGLESKMFDEFPEPSVLWRMFTSVPPPSTHTTVQATVQVQDVDEPKSKASWADQAEEDDLLRLAEKAARWQFGGDDPGDDTSVDY